MQILFVNSIAKQDLHPHGWDLFTDILLTDMRAAAFKGDVGITVVKEKYGGQLIHIYKKVFSLKSSIIFVTCTCKLKETKAFLKINSYPCTTLIQYLRKNKRASYRGNSFPSNRDKMIVVDQTCKSTQKT